MSLLCCARFANSSRHRSPLAVVAALLLTVACDSAPPDTVSNQGEMAARQAQTAEALGIDIRFHDSLSDGSPGPEMIIVPAGEFVIGSAPTTTNSGAGERPPKNISIPQPFALARFPVTVRQYQRFLEASGYIKQYLRDGTLCDVDVHWAPGPDNHPLQSDDHPVVCITYSDALAYVDWLAAETGQRYRLPSESEWEYAARAGTTSRTWWGDGVAPGNYLASTGPSSTLPVDTYLANPLGFQDMLGNVWEIVADCGDQPGHYSRPLDGSALESRSCRFRVSRGGSWRTPSSDIRSSLRTVFFADEAAFHTGFRVAREL